MRRELLVSAALLACFGVATPNRASAQFAVQGASTDYHLYVGWEELLGGHESVDLLTGPGSGEDTLTFEDSDPDSDGAVRVIASYRYSLQFDADALHLFGQVYAEAQTWGSAQSNAYFADAAPGSVLWADLYCHFQVDAAGSYLFSGAVNRRPPNGLPDPGPHPWPVEATEVEFHFGAFGNPIIDEDAFFGGSGSVARTVSLEPGVQYTLHWDSISVADIGGHVREDDKNMTAQANSEFWVTLTPLSVDDPDGLSVSSPLRGVQSWTGMKGGAGNIQNQAMDHEEPRATSAIGNYVHADGTELSFTEPGTHPQVAGAKVTGQASKLGLGQPIDESLISWIPVVSTAYDYISHWPDEPLEEDKRRRSTATALNGAIHVGDCPGKDVVDLNISLEMTGSAAGQADYYGKILTTSAVDIALCLIPAGALKEIGASSFVERQIFEQFLGKGSDVALGLSLDSRFRAFSDVTLGLGGGTFSGVGDDFLAWDYQSQSFDLGVMQTGLAPAASSTWLTDSRGQTGTAETGIIVPPGQTATDTISVQPGTDIPLSLLLRTYAETAGFAAAEARVDSYRIIVSSDDFPDTVVIEADPEWSFPACTPGDPVFVRSNMLSAALSEDLTYGNVSVVGSVAGVSAPDDADLVLIDCETTGGGFVVPLSLPNGAEKRIELFLDILTSRAFSEGEEGHVQIGLTTELQHEVLWAGDVQELLLFDLPSPSDGYELHSGMLTLDLNVSAFSSGQAFLTLAGFADPADCSVGVLAGGLNVVPEPSVTVFFALGGVALLRRKSKIPKGPEARRGGSKIPSGRGSRRRQGYAGQAAG